MGRNSSSCLLFACDVSCVACSSPERIPLAFQVEPRVFGLATVGVFTASRFFGSDALCPLFGSAQLGPPSFSLFICRPLHPLLHPRERWQDKPPWAGEGGCCMACVMVGTRLEWRGHLPLPLCPFLNRGRDDNPVLRWRGAMATQSSLPPSQNCCRGLFRGVGITGTLEMQRKHLPLLHD